MSQNKTKKLPLSAKLRTSVPNISVLESSHPKSSEGFSLRGKLGCLCRMPLWLSLLQATVAIFTASTELFWSSYCYPSGFHGPHFSQFYAAESTDSRPPRPEVHKIRRLPYLWLTLLLYIHTSLLWNTWKGHMLSWSASVVKQQLIKFWFLKEKESYLTSQV